ncbi:MAG: J domain-containing protein [Chloroflexi bacterium]|nr:J domain-containing protein [Chloroflexota bacterium]
MEYKDYYKILGVERNADEKAIKRAFRKLAVQYHPDKNPGDSRAEERFKEINEAYEVLGDPAKRARYDQLGSSYQAWQRTGGAPGGFDWSQWTSGAPGGMRVEVGDLESILGAGFSDFFTSIFGGMGGAQPSGVGGQASPRGRDVEHSLRISLSEAYHGTRRTLARDGKQLEVTIPPGARTGTRVRLSGQGSRGRSQSGDLYLVVDVEPDARFERQGDDLHVDVQTDMYTALLGGEVTVPTPAGDVTLTVPGGSQPGQTFRLKGRGMPQLRAPSARGDLFARLRVTFPTQLTAEEKDLLVRLSKLRNPDAH